MSPTLPPGPQAGLVRFGTPRAARGAVSHPPHTGRGARRGAGGERMNRPGGPGGGPAAFAHTALGGPRIQADLDSALPAIVDDFRRAGVEPAKEGRVTSGPLA